MLSWKDWTFRNPARHTSKHVMHARVDPMGRVRDAPPVRECPECGRMHWHPMGVARCIHCELSAHMVAR